MSSVTALWRATPECEGKRAADIGKGIAKNKSGRTLVQPLCEISDPAKSEVDQAAPIRGLPINYFDFFFGAFFFFEAMVIFLDVEVMNLRQGWFSQVDLGPVSRSFDLGPWASAPLPPTRLPQRGFWRNRKIAKSLYFSVA
jgi:hypothetical protein